MSLGQQTYNAWSLLFQIITAFGIIYFAWRQKQINKRMQELSDYVAVTIAPDNFSLKIMNVGRVNLYLHKWEVGLLGETFVKPLLLPIDGRSQINISIPPTFLGQHLAKFYITAEEGEKYLATGEVAVEPIAFQLPVATTPAVQQENQSGQGTFGSNNQTPLNIQLRMRAWSYKTEKHNWTI
jgi:hypothetical protein